MTDQPSPAPPPTRRRVWLVRFVMAVVLLLIAGELTARFYFGLGDPPLSQADPEIEYLFKPDQDCRRFGRRIKYNHYSMRSEDFPEHKSRKDELRVLVVGDSVVNGGALTDQPELATTILQDQLTRELGRPVVVGNVSAGSWGPPNELAYLKRFGLFEADVVVLVFSSHDAWDVPTFVPMVDVEPSLSSHRPVSALWEGITRYLMPRLGLGGGAAPDGPQMAAATTSPAVRAQCREAIKQLIELARDRNHAVPIVALHLATPEQSTGPGDGHADLVAAATGAGVTPLELGPAFKAAMSDGGASPYRDEIHISARGQKLLADTIRPLIVEAVRGK